jgi:hypothetical protein
MFKILVGNWQSSFKGWKISTFNGVLIAAYFIPAWALPALRIVQYPVRGLYERANVAPAIFVSDYWQFGAVGMMRFAWLLALAKLTVVAFFAVFVLQVLREPRDQRGASDEALSLALILGGVISFVSMLLASHVGEVEALRLHATENLLLQSIGIVMLVENVSAVRQKSTVTSQRKLQGSSADAVTLMARDGYPLSSANS